MGKFTRATDEAHPYESKPKNAKDHHRFVVMPLVAAPKCHDTDGKNGERHAPVKLMFIRQLINKGYKGQGTKRQSQAMDSAEARQGEAYSVPESTVGLLGVMVRVSHADLHSLHRPVI